MELQQLIQQFKNAHGEHGPNGRHAAFLEVLQHPIVQEQFRRAVVREQNRCLDLWVKYLTDQKSPACKFLS